MTDLSRGAFVNLTSFDPSDWETQLSQVDMLSDLGHLELWLEFDPSARQLGTLGTVFAGRSLIMHGPFIGTSFASEWGELVEISIERSRRAIEVAAFLDCKVVTLHAGAYAIFSQQAERLGQVASVVSDFARIAHPRVTIENLPARTGVSREVIGSLDDLDNLCEQVPNLSVTLDVGHCLENGEDFAPFVRRHPKRIANIHLHDAPVGGRSHKALGTGDLDLSGKDRREGVFGFNLASGPAWSPDDKRLAVEQFVSGFPPPTDNSAIVVVPTQPPHEQLELTKYTHRDFSPSWSPNGRTVAFERQKQRGAPRTIFTVPSAGGPAKRIARGGEPDWSPDGKWIALADRGNIYVVHGDGSGRRLLIGGTPIDGKPRWSPNGKRLAFVRARRPGCTAIGCLRDLWVADRAGGNQRLLVRNADSIDW